MNRKQVIDLVVGDRVVTTIGPNGPVATVLSVVPLPRKSLWEIGPAVRVVLSDGTTDEWCGAVWVL